MEIIQSQNKNEQFFAKYIEGISGELGVSAKAMLSGIEIPSQKAYELQIATNEASKFLKKITSMNVVPSSGSILKFTKSSDFLKPLTPSSRENITKLNKTEENEYKLLSVCNDVLVPFSVVDDIALPQAILLKHIVRDMVQGDAKKIERLGFKGKENKQNPTKESEVDMGWIEKVRTNKSTQITSATTGKSNIEIGKGKAYENLDALIIDLISKIPQEKRDDLEIFIHSSLVASRLKALYTNNLEIAVNPKNKMEFYIGGLVANIPAYIPEKTIIITNPKNLAIYYGKTRRIQVEASNSQLGYIFWRSWSQAYVVNDYEAIAIGENVEFV